MKPLKVFYTNTDNSVMSKINEIKAETTINQYDVIVLNEIKPKNGKPPDAKTMNIPGYSLYLGDLDSNHTRGTCVYIKNKYKSVLVNMKDHEFKDYVTTEITINTEKILIQCIYRSGSPDVAIQHDEELHKLIKFTSSLPNYTKKVIVGDFNLNKIKWTPDPELQPNHKENSPEYKFVEVIRDCFLNQHVDQNTRYRSGNKPTTDDLILTKNENDITQLVVKPGVGRSDHVSLVFNIPVCENQPVKPRKIYLYDKTNFSEMKHDFNLDWENLLQFKNVQDSMDAFEHIYHKAVEKHVPTKVIDGDTKFKAPWLNKAALRQIRRKHSAWVRYLNTKQGQHFLDFVCERNKATHVIRKAKRAFEKNIASYCRKDQRSVWKYVKSQSKMTSRIPNLIDKHGKLASTDKEIAEALSKQFEDMFTKEDTSNLPSIPPKKLITEPLSTFGVTREIVEKELKNLIPTKAMGVDKLHPKILKELSSVISHPISLIAQKSLDEGKLPRNWRDGIITPIFKKGAKSDPANYRPVSLTSIVCKCVERIFIRYMIKHVKANQLDTTRQHGFTPGKSITTNLLETFNVFTEALMHNVPIDCVYLDFMKAFDRVPHQRLLLQIASFGITGQALAWIKAFLSDRRQRVIVNGEQSEWVSVSSGIPQGSIMGPILFSLFINDLPEEVTNQINLFADDCKLYQPLHTEDDYIQLSIDLVKLEQWANRMQMKFHPEKCKVLHLGKNNPHQKYHMTKSNGTAHTLESTELEKDLGIFTDTKLSFTNHIQNKINAANKVLGFIKHSFKHIDKDMFLLLYKSLVRPHLEYGSCMWNPHLKYNADAIERVQRRATRLVPGLSDFNYEERLITLNLETLSYRRRRADLLETYRILTGIHSLNTSCHCRLCPNKHMLTPAIGSTRGHSMKLQQQQATGLRCHFFSSRIIQDWNNLSEKTVTSTSIESFKTNLNTDLGHLKFDYKFSY